MCIYDLTPTNGRKSFYGKAKVKCSPGWCTGYADYKETVKAIGAAIKEMREEVKATPTWLQYCREGS